MEKKLLDKLVCPKSKSSLIYNQDNQELLCPVCKLAYPIQDDIPVLLIDEARKLSGDELKQLPTDQINHDK